MAPFDCDDRDPYGTVRSEDADCNGLVMAADCDDADPRSTGRAEDADCDGAIGARDCDDLDPLSLTRAEDGDCDGTPTAQDCDDLDGASTTRVTDADCDGTATALDCDNGDNGFSREYGAREMGRVIQENVKRRLADEILFGSLVDGGVAEIDLVDGQVVIRTGPNAPPVPVEAEAVDA